MKTFALDREPEALIFDLDNTLYTNPAYASFQEEILVERLGRELGFGKEGARARIAGLRAERAKAGLGPTSLGTMFKALGIDIATSVRWREEDIEPADWLAPDVRLERALGRLAAVYKLALMTNNPRRVGEKSLEALGVRSAFSVLVGLDDTMSSKPSIEPFVETARRLGLGVRSCASIGDRYDVDLAPAIALGMGAIHVEGVEEVYGLPDFFAATWGRDELGSPGLGRS